MSHRHTFIFGTRSSSTKRLCGFCTRKFVFLAPKIVILIHRGNANAKIATKCATVQVVAVLHQTYLNVFK